jgi:hypothetical protein
MFRADLDAAVPGVRFEPPPGVQDLAACMREPDGRDRELHFFASATK